ncbi:MAG: twin-arginine translocase subunit TatC [Saprospiraceae bacterium]|nr:twin-arginine translocase subunit TatC [Saprospiraceae bacterium]
MPLDQVDIDELDMGQSKKKEMSFIDHLEELRWMILRSLLAIVLCTIAVFAFKGFFIETVIFGPSTPEFVGYEIICNFSQKVLKGDKLCFSNTISMQNPKMVGQFLTHFKMSFVMGFVLAFPFVFWQVWKFIRPALYKNELTAMRGIVFFAWFFFIIGIMFGYFLILPFSMNFLANYILSDNIQNLNTIGDYTGFITMVSLGAGLMFELPMVIYMLAKIGLVTPKFLRKYRKHAVVILLFVAAMITPPDVITQILIGLPVYLLYELSIFVAAWVQKKQPSNG